MTDHRFGAHFGERNRRNAIPERTSPSSSISTTPRNLLDLSIPALRQRQESFRIVDTRTSGPRSIVVAVQEPRVRVTKWHLGGRHDDRVLSLPRWLFVASFFRGGFDNLYGFILRRPYVDATTRVYHSILPNSGSNGWICMGTGDTRDVITRETRSNLLDQDKVDVVLAAYWNSNFNEDLMDRFADHAPRLHPDLSTIASWERASRQRPSFIDSVLWEPAGTVGGVMRRLRGTR